MKSKLILGIFSLLLVFAATSWGATKPGQCMPYQKNQPMRDPGDAWPWGAELPFPWRGIQGTWETEIDGCVSYFSFKPKTAGGVKQLKVVQYDPVTCQTVAEGIGFEDNRVVRAILNDKRGKTFRVTIHVFNPADLREEDSNMKFAAKTVTVMNMGPLGASDEERTNHALEKVSTDPRAICQ